MKIKTIMFLIGCILFYGCGNHALSPLEYVEWVENPENGLQLKKKQEAYVFSLQYQPIEYNIVNELQQLEIPKNVLDKERAQREGLQYFTFKISTSKNQAIFSGKSNLEDSVKTYLNYKMQKDFYLIERGDTMRCKLFHYENTNGLTPYDAFVLGFETSKHDVVTDKTFLFKTSVVDLNPVEITIRKTALSKIPKLATL